MYKAQDVLADIEDIRGLGRAAYASQQAKILDHIDELCRLWIERSPFLTMATSDADGRLDVSPKGDPAGFVRVLDAHTLAIPDRPGNHRYDSLHNILQTGSVGLCFMVPNRNEVVRVNGTARVVRDLELRESMAINGRVPDIAILVRVQEAFYHCGKSIIRSKLWVPEQAAPTVGLPTYAEAIKQHAEDQRPIEEIEEVMRDNDTRRLYEE